MPGKKWIAGALLGLLLSNTGCCRMWDRWCGHTPNYPPSGYAPAQCVPCAPVQQQCCPTPNVYSGSSPAPSSGNGWVRPANCP